MAGSAMPFKDPDVRRAYQRERTRLRRAGRVDTPVKVPIPTAVRVQTARDGLLLLEEQLNALPSASRPAPSSGHPRPVHRADGSGARPPTALSQQRPQDPPRAPASPTASRPLGTPHGQPSCRSAATPTAPHRGARRDGRRASPHRPCARRSPSRAAGNGRDHDRDAPRRDPRFALGRPHPRLQQRPHPPNPPSNPQRSPLPTTENAPLPPPGRAPHNARRAASNAPLHTTSPPRPTR